MLGEAGGWAFARSFDGRKVPQREHGEHGRANANASSAAVQRVMRTMRLGGRIEQIILLLIVVVVISPATGLRLHIKI